MLTVIYYVALAATLGTGAVLLMEPYHHTLSHARTREEVRRAMVDYIGNNCGALPAAIDNSELQTAGRLPAGFDNQGVSFTFTLGPAIGLNLAGNPEYLAFAAGERAGVLQADGSYSFLPGLDESLYRAANPGYQLLAFNDMNFDC